NVPDGAVLEITYVGHVLQEVKAAAEVGTIILHEVSSDLDEVEVIMSTGYYTVPKERATGSFTHVDSALFNRAIGGNVLERLEGIAPGVQFVNANGTSASDIRVRGLSTIESDET